MQSCKPAARCAHNRIILLNCPYVGFYVCGTVCLSVVDVCVELKNDVYSICVPISYALSFTMFLINYNNIMQFFVSCAVFCGSQVNKIV